MTSVDPTGRLLASLRQETQEWRRQQAAQTGRTAEGRTRRPGDLHQAMDAATAEVLAIDRSDPDARRKAFRAYLSAVLLKEFGAGLASDSAFAGLVDRVQHTMEADATLKGAIERAGELMLKKAGRA